MVVGVLVGEDLLNRHPRSEQLQQHLHRIPQSTDHRLAVADPRFGGDPVASRHAASVPPDGIDGRVYAGDLRLSAAKDRTFKTVRPNQGTTYENVAGQGVTARCSGGKPGPEMIPAHVRHAAHLSRLRSGHEAREQKGNKPWPTKPHWTNQTHRYRAQNAPARAQQHGSELWSPVRDEEAAGSNPVTPTSVSAGERRAPELVRASLAASTAAKYGQYSNESEN